MTVYRKTEDPRVYKRTEEDFRKIVEEQGRALYLVNKRLKERTSEVRHLNMEVRHLKQVIKKMEGEKNG